MKKILIVIDAQNDFVYGILGSKEAVDAANRIRQKIDSLNDEDIVIFTRDTHDENYVNTLEGKKLPVVHCVKDTPGWEVIDILKNTAKRLKYSFPAVIGTLSIAPGAISLAISISTPFISPSS